MISRRKLYAAGEPFGEACTRTAFGKHRVYGAGGGDSGSNYYANQDRLLGVQADIAQGIYNNIYQPYAPGAVANLGEMVDEANSGALTARARATAGADAGAAIGQGIDAANRNLTRYGINPNSTKFAAMNTTNALQGAALKSDAMNKAEQWGESQKWGRTYDFYNSLSGVPSQASSSLGSAAAGYGQMGGQQSNADMANAQGYGRAGGMVGRAIFSKDGGLVRSGRGYAAKVARRGVGMANGGLMRLPDWRSRPSNVRSSGGADPMTSFVGSATMAAGTEVLKGVAKPYLEPIKAGIKGIFSPAAEAGSIGGTTAEGLAAADTAAGLIPAAEGATAVGTTAAAAEGATAAGAAAAEGATAAGAAAAEGAAAAAGSTALTAVGTALPWVGAGLLVAKGLGLFKDGGKVNASKLAARGITRKDMASGGRVRGPGGPREDKVPAQLSDGEYVLPAKTVTALGGAKVLDPIVQATNDGRPPVPSVKGGTEHAASGGMLGVALGAATDEINRGKIQDRADRADVRAQEQLELVKQSAVQEQALRGIQLQRATQSQTDDAAFRAQLDGLRADVGRIRSGDLAPAEQFISNVYNKQQGPFNDGATVAFSSAPNGGAIGTRIHADGKQIPFALSNEQVVDAYVKGRLGELAFTSPEMFKSWVAQNAAAAEKAAERGSHEKIAAGNNAATREGNQLNFTVGMANAGAHQTSANATAQNAGLAAKRWTIEMPEVQARTEDAKSVRAARKDLIDAIDSGDAKAIDKAKQKAIAAGIKFEKPNNEFTATTDSMGMNVTRTNKDTGQVDIINPKDGSVKTIPAPGASKAPPPTQADIDATAKKYGITADEVKKRLGIK